MNKTASFQLSDVKSIIVTLLLVNRAKYTKNICALIGIGI